VKIQHDGKELFHKRLSDWEAFDRITFDVVPRFKTSGLSGDEWRQHVQVRFWHKGEVVFETGYRDMRCALALAQSDFLRQQEPIPERVIELEQESCDQPSCPAPPVGRFALKKQTSDRGDYLDMTDQYFGAYRQFCKKHLRRGDCSREDADDNYEPIDAATAEDSTNLEESPSVLASPIMVNSVEDIPAALAKLRKE
jgi:hypothetical protein